MTGAVGRAPGRVRRRLIALLEAEGFSDVLIYAAQGRERSDPREDINRWNGHGRRGGLTVGLYSWFTMTECVRKGIATQRDDTAFEVFPRSVRINPNE